MKTVFVNELKICFTNEKCHPEMEIFPISGNEEMTNFVNHLFSKPPDWDICLPHPAPDQLFLDFARYFVWLDAAGGVVQDEQHRFLFIRRFGLWDLPKGKVELGESFAEAGLREVSEETGIQQLHIIDSLPDTYHIYTEKERNILKCTHWYAMKAPGNQPLIPQTKEQITEACWLSAEEGQRAIGASYRSLRETLGYCFT